MEVTDEDWVIYHSWGMAPIWCASVDAPLSLGLIIMSKNYFFEIFKQMTLNVPHRCRRDGTGSDVGGTGAMLVFLDK